MGDACARPNAVISGVDNNKNEICCITTHCFWMTIFAHNNNKGEGGEGEGDIQTDRQREIAHTSLWGLFVKVKVI